MATTGNKSPISLPSSVKVAAAELLRAYDYAADAGVDCRQFAVELSLLESFGLTRSDLRWLLAKGYARHAQETTPPGAPQRALSPLAPTAFPERTCLWLTEAGAEQLRPLATTNGQVSIVLQSYPNFSWTPRSGARLTQSTSRPIPLYQSTPVLCPVAGLAPAPLSGQSATAAAESELESAATEAPDLAADPPESPLPEWNPNVRELRYRGQVVKRYRVAASNQERILNAFQEEGWPRWIDDPLPPVPEIEPKRRLQATIKSLNRHQLAPLLRFHVHQGGKVVAWEPVRG